MALRYVGITRNGEKIKGEFLGTKEELVRLLQKDKILLVSVEESKRVLKKGKYTIGDFASDIEELSYLVSSGLPIDKAIQTLMKNLRKESSLKIWEGILSEIRQGKQLSLAIKTVFDRHNLYISRFYINIISVGEEVGNISSALKDVSEHLQFRMEIIKETKAALSYPLFVLTVSIIAVFFIAYFILPKFATIFTAKDLQSVPLISLIFIEFGQFVHQNPALVIFGFFSFVGLVFSLFSFPKTKGLVMEIFQQLPFVKDIALELHIANICVSLGTMIEGGVDIAKAMRLTSDVVSHKRLKDIVRETAEGLKKGLKISDIWSKYEIIPADVVSLVFVGENSAKLGEIFKKLGKRHLDDFKVKVSKAVTFLEPITIVLLGLFIGLVVVSIMLAVLSLTNVS